MVAEKKHKIECKNLDLSTQQLISGIEIRDSNEKINNLADCVNQFNTWSVTN